jgi:putative colanic acid biosynthesis acetyltransferase WcaF
MIDVKSNRENVKWRLRVQVARVAWALVQPLFRLSPRPLWGWRRAILKLFSAEVGAQAHIYPTVRITMPWNVRIGDYAAIGDRTILYALGSINIGDRVTISQGTHLCAGTHDWRRADMPLLKPPIHISDDAWICADAFIGPGVTIGAFAIVGARSVVTKDVLPSSIVVGNPARQIKTRDEPAATQF